MPLDRLVLILVSVVIAAGVTIWLGVFLTASLALPVPAIVVLIPIGLIAYVIWRVIVERLQNTEDDHYDTIEK